MKKKLFKRVVIVIAIVIAAIVAIILWHSDRWSRITEDEVREISQDFYVPDSDVKSRDTVYTRELTLELDSLSNFGRESSINQQITILLTYGCVMENNVYRIAWAKLKRTDSNKKVKVVAMKFLPFRGMPFIQESMNVEIYIRYSTRFHKYSINYDFNAFGDGVVEYTYGNENPKQIFLNN
jgi:hypothetical protein